MGDINKDIFTLVSNWLVYLTASSPLFCEKKSVVFRKAR